MSDTPPPELVERLVPQVLRAAYGAVVSPAERIRIERVMPRILAALAEWADGGLIDPSTWEVVEAKPAERWHKLYDLDGKVICNHPERDYCSHADEGDWSNWTYTLSPRGGERERCPAGICRRPAGHAGPHSDLPREGER